ncbi:hypothetical protein BpHYR1_033376 [Brachionus plicatilis]|uniref:Uncharacterized protein n=1 Tax=Brachionus plicatilis TaxID=10195 RepID=A0A3M7SQT3_BRAPC|nr:hypothetical protein BpHYR1_033376 [Brachionus plicatilis]
MCQYFLDRVKVEIFLKLADIGRWSLIEAGIFGAYKEIKNILTSLFHLDSGHRIALNRLTVEMQNL